MDKKLIAKAVVDALAPPDGDIIIKATKQGLIQIECNGEVYAVLSELALENLIYKYKAKIKDYQ